MTEEQSCKELFEKRAASHTEPYSSLEVGLEVCATCSYFERDTFAGRPAEEYCSLGRDLADFGEVRNDSEVEPGGTCNQYENAEGLPSLGDLLCDIVAFQQMGTVDWEENVGKVMADVRHMLSVIPMLAVAKQERALQTCDGLLAEFPMEAPDDEA